MPCVNKCLNMCGVSWYSSVRKGKPAERGLLVQLVIRFFNERLTVIPASTFQDKTIKETRNHMMG